MPKSKVVILRCKSYNENKVYDTVKRGIELLGGARSFAKPDEKIILKPNVVSGDAPEKSITSHPTIFKVAAQIFKETGADMYYGDSPGFGKAASHLKKACLSAKAEELKIKLADFDKGKEVNFQRSPFTKKFIIANGVLDSDGLISISKLKTHQLMRITGAVKNQFGCIPGILKAEFHVKLPDPYDFARMLVALNLFLKTRLYIMDGITAMQGNGPRSGEPVNMNVLLFSKDPVALDAVMCRIIDLNPEFVPTITIGQEYGLGTYNAEDIELVGDPLESVINKKFDVIRSPIVAAPKNAIISYLKNIISPRPVIDSKLCVKCGICVDVCPVTPKAVDWHDTGCEKLHNSIKSNRKQYGKGDRKLPPSFDYTRCIRCFCCQELCPEKAISVKTPLLWKLLFQGNLGQPK